MRNKHKAGNNVIASKTAKKTLRQRRMMGAAALGMLPVAAMAQQEVTSRMVSGLCSMLGPLVGPNSQVLSMIFLVSLGVMVFLWFMNENKEGVMVWLIRTALALAILINLFTLPRLLGLPSIC